MRTVVFCECDSLLFHLRTEISDHWPPLPQKYDKYSAGREITDQGGFKGVNSLAPLKPPIHCQMIASSLVAIVCLAFSGADIEFDFVLMTDAYSQYLKDSCKQY